ncbi:hypothetical protein ACJX0J_007208, partial [Zea mays]
ILILIGNWVESSWVFVWISMDWFSLLFLHTDNTLLPLYITFIWEETFNIDFNIIGVVHLVQPPFIIDEVQLYNFITL